LGQLRRLSPRAEGAMNPNNGRNGASFASRNRKVKQRWINRHAQMSGKDRSETELEPAISKTPSDWDWAINFEAVRNP